MSPATEPGAVAAGGGTPKNLVRPVWLRPLVMTLVIGAHLAALVGFGWFLAEKITPLDEIRVELVPQGETVTETRAFSHLNESFGIPKSPRF